ncbi:MAG: hypothetical protein JWO31_1998 [Phycisphaerales bacterium]|nr:hypothetical protein [Phycisphaerales bacterium]
MLGKAAAHGSSATLSGNGAGTGSPMAWLRTKEAAARVEKEGPSPPPRSSTFPVAGHLSDPIK